MQSSLFGITVFCTIFLLLFVFSYPLLLIQTWNDGSLPGNVKSENDGDAKTLGIPEPHNVRAIVRMTEHFLFRLGSALTSRLNGW